MKIITDDKIILEAFFACPTCKKVTSIAVRHSIEEWIGCSVPCKNCLEQIKIEKKKG
jgi:transcription elongation factor Elf1